MIRFLKLAASGLVIGMTLTGGIGVPASHSEAGSEMKQIKIAAKAAAKATKSLDKSDFAAAVGFAEMAVEYQPRDPSYRMLLGQSYLGFGRFAAAETSFADALALSPDDGRAALNLALVEIAQGKRDRAIGTLADYRDKLSAADYGLAIALAGDSETGVRTLESAIRAGGADAKVRQNLALAYALNGKWVNARVMAVQDLPPAEADARIVQWAQFVRPKSSYDQVAALLGVTPVEDGGQPTRLALLTTPTNAIAAVETPVVVAQAAEPIIARPVIVAQADVQAPAVVPIVDTPPAAFETNVDVAANFVPVIRAQPKAMKQVVVPASRATSSTQPVRSVAAGKFVVQLGAFQNAAVSKDAWQRLAPKYGLRGFDPANSAARVNGANFVRLSVGGFVTRAEAVGVCTRIRSAGGTCFVRGLLGDAPAQWVQRGMPRPVRVAAR